MGPPAPPPLRRVEPQPRLIQRMESGYESSERNSSSPDRWGRKIPAASVRGAAPPPPNKLSMLRPSQGGGATEAGADVGPFLAIGAQVQEQRRHPAGAAVSGLGGCRRRSVV